MPGLFPEITPIPVPDADVPYTGKLVWLSIVPRVEGGSPDATATIRTKPFRVLSNGNIDAAPDSMDVTLHFPSVVQASQSDPRVAKSVGMIVQAVREYLSPPQE